MRSALLKFMVASVSGGLVAHAADSAPPGGSLSLGDVVRLVGEANPHVAAAREGIAAARADREAAGKWTNPTVSYDHFRPSGGERTVFDAKRQESVTAELPLPLLGQRAARIGKADADLAVAEARVALETGSLAGDALVSFIRLLAAQEKAAILKRTFADVNRLKDTVVERRKSGEATDYDVNRVELESAKVGERLETGRADVAAEAAQLATLLALSGPLPAAEGELRPFELGGDLLSIRADPRSAPLAVIAARESEAAEAGLLAAKRERLPAVGIAAGRTWTRAPYGAADYIGLNAEVPIFDSRRAQWNKARAEARAAEARHRVALAESSAAFSQWQQALERRKAIYDRYREDVRPRLERLKQMSADAYSFGRLSLLESIDAEQARLDVELGGIEATAALVEAQIRLLATSGRLMRFIAESLPKERP